MKKLLVSGSLFAIAGVTTLVIALGGIQSAKAAIIFNAHVHDDYFHPTGSFVVGPGHSIAQSLCMGATPNPACTATIQTGDSVNWLAPAPLAVNPHSVTECTDGTWTTCGAGTASGNPIEDSGVRFQPGWPYVVQFNTAGTYYYRCEIHPTTMRGVVQVYSAPGVGGITEVFVGGETSGNSSTPYLLLAALGAIVVAGAGAGFAFRRRGIGE